ncbi:hypothetical protein BWI96_17250 [Siphonobacter sp. SORGH_AS_0500]|nr:hypothetical protein BWI96_17250 [Siphonobacter sp. SORGH_AS_0500]
MLNINNIREYTKFLAQTQIIKFMGFFDSLFKAQPVQITINDEREAFVSILYACACADGYLSDDEIDELASFLSTKDKFLRTSNAMPYIL